MAGKFEIKSASGGKFTFNLKAANNQVILSSQLYQAKSGAKNGIESVKKHAADDSNFKRKESKAGDPYFVLEASNGQVIGKSEMYSSKDAMENGIRSVKTNAPSAEVADLTE